MNKRDIIRGILRLIRAYLFYPTAIGVMIWLILNDKHWGWGVIVLAAVLIFDPIYRIMLRRILSWRPHKN